MARKSPVGPGSTAAVRHRPAKERPPATSERLDARGRLREHRLPAHQVDGRAPRCERSGIRPEAREDG